MLEVGSIAYDFTAKSDSLEEVNLSDFRGKNVVLYFYPKDDTPGCTIESQDFSKKIDEFKKLDTIVFGISMDNVDSHCKFIKKYDLSIHLLADIDGEICNKYGVLKEKSIFGKKYYGIDRSTFLIDKTGKVKEIWRSVKVNGHVAEVLESVKNLTKDI